MEIPEKGLMLCGIQGNWFVCSTPYVVGEQCTLTNTLKGYRTSISFTPDKNT